MNERLNNKDCVKIEDDFAQIDRDSMRVEENLVQNEEFQRAVAPYLHHIADIYQFSPATYELLRDGTVQRKFTPEEELQLEIAREALAMVIRKFGGG